MINTQRINKDIHRLTIPYKDIYTTIYTVHTDQGVLLFDSGSYDEDIENYVVPFLEELGITPQMLKCVFISHNHADHAGGLASLIKIYPETRIFSLSEPLLEKFSDCSVYNPKDRDIILEVLKVVTIPGHTMDSSAILDTRTKTLISGDSLQLYGNYGSGKWGANISFPSKHIEAIDKLRSMDIQCILTAHDYHPCGHIYVGKDEVARSLDCCIEPLRRVEYLILQHPDLNDEQICGIYNSSENLPTLGEHVVSAIRKMQII